MVTSQDIGTPQTSSRDAQNHPKQQERHSTKRDKRDHADPRMRCSVASCWRRRRQVAPMAQIGWLGSGLSSQVASPRLIVAHPRRKRRRTRTHRKGERNGTMPLCPHFKTKPNKNWQERRKIEVNPQAFFLPFRARPLLHGIHE